MLSKTGTAQMALFFTVRVVYINTIMLQNILSNSNWFNLMTPEDFRALTPLVYTPINPYGTFKLNMSERLPLEEGVIA